MALFIRHSLTIVRHYQVGIFFLLLISLGSCSIVTPRPDPWTMDQHISSETKALLKEAFAFDAATFANHGRLTIVDYHVHLAARGTHKDSHDAYINPNRYTWWHPILLLRTSTLLDASQVFDYEQLDTQYKDRLLTLMRHFHEVQKQYTPDTAPPTTVQFYLYAMDYYHGEKGNPVKQHTDLYVPNDYVIKTAERFNQEQISREQISREKEAEAEGQLRIIPVASVHPYREDFQQAVSKLAQQGVRYMKWLPSTMNIDLDKVPADHYLTMAKYKIVLLTHTGDEHVLQTKSEKQVFGDPYRLRKPLDCGVNVVALHNGRGGKEPDTGVPYFERFLDMMAEEKYQGRLFGEISAMTLGRILFWAGSHEKLSTVIQESQESGILHNRLINGSDYPVPAVSRLNPTRELADRKMISQDERLQLNEILAYNPLLFDFVLKRTIRSIGEDDKPQHTLPDSVFLEHHFYQTATPENTPECR